MKNKITEGQLRAVIREEIAKTLSEKWGVYDASDRPTTRDDEDYPMARTNFENAARETFEHIAVQIGDLFADEMTRMAEEGFSPESHEHFALEAKGAGEELTEKIMALIAKATVDFWK